MAKAPLQERTRRILVCGSRDWEDRWAIYDALRHHAIVSGGPANPPIIVHGGCPTGADKIADVWCRRLRLTTAVYTAEWGRYGKSAGPRRNEEMLDSGVGLVLAFQRNGSRGTQHTIDGARKRGIPVEVING